MMDPSLIPLEKALLVKADDLDARDAPEHVGPGGGPANRWLAAEFRALAEELHHQ